MKHSIVLLICLTCMVSTYSQTSKQNEFFTISKISLSFYPPDGFKLVDSSSFEISPNPKIKVWHQRFKFTKGSSTLNFSISTSTQKDMDWANIHNVEAKHFFDQVIAENPGTNFDSTLSTISIDSKEFNKFFVTGKKDGVITYNNVQLSSFVKGYRVIIAYHYKTPEIAAQIENALAAAKFSD